MKASCAESARGKLKICFCETFLRNVFHCAFIVERERGKKGRCQAKCQCNSLCLLLSLVQDNFVNARYLVLAIFNGRCVGRSFCMAVFRNHVIVVFYLSTYALDDISLHGLESQRTEGDMKLMTQPDCPNEQHLLTLMDSRSDVLGQYALKEMLWYHLSFTFITYCMDYLLWDAVKTAISFH